MSNKRSHAHKGDEVDKKVLTYLEITPHLANKVIQSLNEGIVITDLKGTILHVNQAFCDITGYSKMELLGKNPRILKSNLHDRFFYHRIWNSIEAEGSWRGEIWNRQKSGRLYLQKLSILPIRNEHDQIVQYLGVTTDISEEDKLQKDMIRTGKLQRSLLPSPIHEEMIFVDSIYAPNNYLSGDLFEYEWDSQSKVLFGYMIDIMGHGLTAAFQHSILRVLFNQRFTKDVSLTDILTEINQESKDYFLEDTFAAAFCFRLDLNSMELTYSCAGLNKFLRTNKDGRKEMVKQPGPYLGIMKDADFKEECLTIERGESLYLLTDGFMDYIEAEGHIHFSGNFNEMMKHLRIISEQGLKDDASAIGIHLPILREG